VRNLLAPLVYGIPLLRMQGDDTPLVRQTLDRMEHQTALMGRLLDDAAERAGSRTKAIPLQRASVNIGTLARRVVLDFEELARAAAIRLVCSAPPTPVSLDGDAARLELAILNLVVNALKFTPKGGKVELTVSETHDQVRVSVADNGVGIPAHELPHIFASFVRGEAGAAARAPGLGLGLALVREVAELHGGRVEAQSDGPGKGSVFVIELPQKPPGAAPDAGA
jgi:signal transduction histidine kinase